MSAVVRIRQLLDLDLFEKCKMQNLEIGNEVRELRCGHIFHKTCIESWLTRGKPECPLDGIKVDL